MDLLAELRSARAAKFLTAFLAVFVLVAVAWLLVTGYVLSRIVYPSASGTIIDATTLLGNPSLVSISGPGVTAREGVFFPGQRGAPAIVLAHGYRSNLSDLLTLALALQENKYNVFLFDFGGHGKTPGSVTLGYRETRELLAAIEAVMQRDDVSRTEVGVFGMDMGGYAALQAAATDARIRAVAVDSLYNSPPDMLRMQVDGSGIGGLPLVPSFCRWAFRLVHFSDRNQPTLLQRVEKLPGVPKLFIQARDKPIPAETTLQIFLVAAEPRQQAVVPKSSLETMTDEEKRDYEAQVVGFFLQNLPPIPKPTS